MYLQGLILQGVILQCSGRLSCCKVLYCTVVECKGEMEAFDPLTGVAADEQRISQGMKLFTLQWWQSSGYSHHHMVVRSWWSAPVVMVLVLAPMMVLMAVVMVVVMTVVMVVVMVARFTSYETEE